MWKKIIIAILLILTLTLKDNPAEKHHRLTLYVATDIHYLSPALFDGGERFQRMVENADGKLVEKTNEILQKLVDDALQNKPDGVILTGDLTFNGERASLQDIKNILTPLQDANIPVYLIPGNHDIASSSAYKYVENTIEPTQNISSSEFKEIVGQFGYDNAILKDPNSFSYCLKLAEDAWLLAIDVNTEDAPNRIKEETFDFIEKVVEAANKTGASLLTVSHQSLLTHFPNFPDSLIIQNNDRLKEILSKSNHLVHLSGHAHIQHETTANNLTEIITESLSVYPLQYGILEIEEDSYVYSAKSLDILQDESKDRFYTVNRNKLLASLSEIPTDKKEKMIDYAITLNEGLYQGNIDPSLLDDSRLLLWQAYAPNHPFFTFLQEMYQIKR